MTRATAGLWQLAICSWQRLASHCSLAKYMKKRKSGFFSWAHKGRMSYHLPLVLLYLTFNLWNLWGLCTAGSPNCP